MYPGRCRMRFYCRRHRGVSSSGAHMGNRRLGGVFSGLISVMDVGLSDRFICAFLGSFVTSIVIGVLAHVCFWRINRFMLSTFGEVTSTEVVGSS